MHIPTHILSGWCVGNALGRMSARERLFCMIAATAPDLDGLGYVVSMDAYWDYHHKLGHGIFAAVFIAGVLTLFSDHKRLAFVTYFALAHLHFVLDYFGSGPGWPIHYLWPASDWGIVNPRAWPFTSWQNYAAFSALLAWTVWIAARYRRTPIEVLTPRLDRAIIARLPARASRPTGLKPDAPLPINPS
jgi:hypothetical protein